MEGEAVVLIRETVMEILKESDMDRMTESKVRKQAAERLSMDLGSAAARKLVRKTVEDFLASRANDDDDCEEAEAEEQEDKEEVEEEKNPSNPADVAAVEEEEEARAEEEEEEERRPPARGKRPFSSAASNSSSSSRQKVQSSYGTGDSFLLPLSNKRNVSLQDWRGKKLVSIRDYYEKNGELLPGSKGISLTMEQWEVLKKNVASIDKAIAKLQS